MRAARQDAARRRACFAYAAIVSLAQLGWTVLIVLHLSIAATVLLSVILALVEFAGPILAERLGRSSVWRMVKEDQFPTPRRLS